MVILKFNIHAPLNTDYNRANENFLLTYRCNTLSRTLQFFLRRLEITCFATITEYPSNLRITCRWIPLDEYQNSPDHDLDRQQIVNRIPQPQAEWEQAHDTGAGYQFVEFINETQDYPLFGNLEHDFFTLTPAQDHEYLPPSEDRVYPNVPIPFVVLKSFIQVTPNTAGPEPALSKNSPINRRFELLSTSSESQHDSPQNGESRSQGSGRLNIGDLDRLGYRGFINNQEIQPNSVIHLPDGNRDNYPGRTEREIVQDNQDYIELSDSGETLIEIEQNPENQNSENRDPENQNISENPGNQNSENQNISESDNSEEVNISATDWRLTQGLFDEEQSEPIENTEPGESVQNNLEGSISLDNSEGPSNLNIPKNPPKSSGAKSSLSSNHSSLAEPHHSSESSGYHSESSGG